MSERQVKSKERVADHGEVFTAQREVNAMLDLVKQETERTDNLSLVESLIDDSIETFEKRPCVVQSKHVLIEHYNFRFLSRRLWDVPLSMIRGILYRMREGILWKYDCYWETENEECYNNKDFDEEEHFIIKQLFLPANCILMGDNAIDESAFPWHGHSLEDFILLNDKLQECIEMVQNIREPKDVKRFRRKYRIVYDAFFEIPICLFINGNNEYCFGADGRHRIYAASASNGLLPVWIIEYKDPRSVSIEYYKKHARRGTWRFLERI